jgi:antitoxin MazE
MWGNSLAIRIPAECVASLNLQPGEEAWIEVTPDQKLLIGRDRSRQKAIEAIRKMRVVVPADFTFNRAEIYDE